jgi:chloramphenicol-sensitive protein RarD
VNPSRQGFIAALICYLLWGVFPVYFKWLESVPATEVLLHRIIWAVPFGALIIHMRRQWAEVRRALTHRIMLAWLAASALCIALNWYIYIYAVQAGQIFQASLGYYINPLIFVLAGVVIFEEKLRRLQLAAVLLAAAGVLVLSMSGGEFPAIALGLAVLFAAYGIIRKRVVIGAMPGLFVETVLLAPVAAAGLFIMLRAGSAAIESAGPGMTGLLLLAGPLTVIPLLFFALAARRLSLTAIGFMQFIAPTLQFVTGVYYGEELTLPRIICFGCIWAAVAVFSMDALRNSRRRQVAPAA